MSKDTDIVEKVEKICKKNPESPIVIPFLYGEILENSPIDKFLNRVREFMFSRDLFSMSSPLRRDMYFWVSPFQGGAATPAIRQTSSKTKFQCGFSFPC